MILMSYTIKSKHEVKTAFQMQRRIHHRDLQVTKSSLCSCTPIVKCCCFFCLRWTGLPWRLIKNILVLATPTGPWAKHPYTPSSDFETCLKTAQTMIRLHVGRIQIFSWSFFVRDAQVWHRMVQIAGRGKVQEGWHISIQLLKCKNHKY